MQLGPAFLFLGSAFVHSLGRVLTDEHESHPGRGVGAVGDDAGAAFIIEESDFIADVEEPGELIFEEGEPPLPFPPLPGPPPPEE